MPAEFTPKDYREARSMGISLDAPLDGYAAAVQRLYNTLTTAYERLDEECARAHCAERNVRAERDQARVWVKRLGWILAVVMGIAAGEGWVIAR